MQNGFLTSAFRMGFVSRGIIDWPGVVQYTEEILDKFDVKATGTDALASSLSGGNLQKFIVGREILQGPQLLVVSQPTWGVDAGAAAAIHEKIQQMISAGAGALVISQDLDEIFALSDRIAVISQGNSLRPDHWRGHHGRGGPADGSKPSWLGYGFPCSRLKPGRHSQPMPPGYRRCWR